MFRCFFPDEYLDSAYEIDYEKLYEEGYRGLIYDIDNTLVPHGAPADDRAIALFEQLRGIGFGYCLLSNNQIERVAPFANAIQARYIENAHKPEGNGTSGNGYRQYDFYRGSAFYRCIRSQKDRHPQYSRKADPSKRRNPDRSETISGKNSTTFLQKGGGDFMNHVVIIGFMGSGKTRVGKQLSKDLGLQFVDLDKLITKKMNLSAREIFEKFGEPYYRALETVALKQLIQDPERKVISLGAGVPLQEQNEKYLKELGTVVYLKGSLTTLKKRLADSKKDPMLDGEDRDDKIKKLLKQRDPVYQKFADIQVVTGEVPFEELIKEIEEKLSTYEKNS